MLGVLGCFDALLTSVVADSLTRQEHNSDKELVGQGIGNVMSGLFGGLPGAGATMGTVVAIQAGALQLAVFGPAGTANEDKEDNKEDAKTADS